MNIGIVGTGYVGLVTGLCFAELGSKVICADNNEKKIEDLSRGITPFVEAGVDELLAKHLKSKRITFTSELAGLCKASDVIFIAVGTPSDPNGEYDLTSIEKVAQQLAKYITNYTVVVVKSTVTVGCTEDVAKHFSKRLEEGRDFDIAFCPEFLSEGQAVHGFMHPYRTVVGARSEKAFKILEELHAPLAKPVLKTSLRDAEMIKLASNVFLATKISYINELARICELTETDVKVVTKGMGLDPRIGNRFLNAGTGFGGPCLKKDTLSLIRQAEQRGYDPKLLDGVMFVNENIPRHIVQKLEDKLGKLKGKRIGVLGLSFKAGTSDMRDSQALVLIELLLKKGARVLAYDPAAADEARCYPVMKRTDMVNSAYEACEADAAVIMTEWPEIKKMDLEKVSKLLASRLLIDGRNMLDRAEATAAGLIYDAMGH